MKVALVALCLVGLGACTQAGVSGHAAQATRSIEPSPSPAAGSGPSPSPSPSPSFPSGSLLIDTGNRKVHINALIASSSAQQEYGLMNRTSLPSDTGMLFVFHQPTTTAFWMKDTKIPLSIAFFSRAGRLLRMFDMTPCRSATCHIYRPGVVYRRALEVNQGAFTRWGVSVGDHMRKPG